MSGPLQIRLARAVERSLLVALQVRASLANEGDRALVLAHLGEIDLPLEEIVQGRVFVAERDGSVLGFAAILPRDDGEVGLDGLFVEPDAWKGGAGRALVLHAVAQARASGARALHVVGNTHALGFYARLGFTVVGEEQTPFGPVAPRLVRAL